MAKCNRCGADIEWTKDKRTGRRVPVDRDPIADGHLGAEIDGTGERISWPLLPLVKYDGPRFTLHWTTCTRLS